MLTEESLETTVAAVGSLDLSATVDGGAVLEGLPTPPKSMQRQTPTKAVRYPSFWLPFLRYGPFADAEHDVLTAGITTAGKKSSKGNQKKKKEPASITANKQLPVEGIRCVGCVCQ